MTIENSRGPVELEATRPPSYYNGYSGYDTAFLHTKVPLPVLTNEQRHNAAKQSGAAGDEDPTVLTYTHFSLVLNRVRQLAYYTVVNIDGTQLVALPRARDRWYFDPRIAESEQIGEELYRRNALDRGHLVRRLDPVWGPGAARPGDDTFHFTNCAPQHERFNHRSDLWQGLENYILDHAEVRGRRITVFTGPVLDDSDPLYKGVRLPLAYWKIVAYDRVNGSLAVAAYILEQAKLVDDLLRTEAVFEPGPYRVTLDHLIDRTGLDFRYLRESELPLSSGGLERGTDHIRLREDFSNLVLR